MFAQAPPPPPPAQLPWAAVTSRCKMTLGLRPAPRRMGRRCEFQPPGPQPLEEESPVPRRDSCSQLLLALVPSGEGVGTQTRPPRARSCPAPTGEPSTPPTPAQTLQAPAPRHFGLESWLPIPSWAPLGPRGRAGNAARLGRNEKQLREGGAGCPGGLVQLTKQGLLESAAAAAVPRQAPGESGSLGWSSL